MRKRIKLFSLLFFLLNLFLTVPGFSQLYYRYPIENYAPKQYGVEQGPQNWCITQDKEGLIYVGNSNGVMRYDGTTWDFIPVILGQKVFSLAVDSNNTVFVGSSGQFGYFEKDEKGKMSFVSLIDSLTNEDRQFTNVWRTFAAKDKVYFQSYEAIFVYDYKKVSVIRPKVSFHLSMLVDGNLFARERQKGLVKIVGDKTEIVNSSEVTSVYGIFGLLPDEINKSRLMLITQELGLFWMNKANGNLEEIVTPDKDFLIRAKIFGGIKLPGNLFALNTEYSGTVIVDELGVIKKIISDESGLQNNYVLAQYFDKTGNLWLGLNQGLSKVDWFSPIQTFDKAAGLNGIINDAVIFGDALYVASSDGIFIKSFSSAKFEKDKNFHHAAKKLFVWDNSLLIGGENGLYQINKNGTSKVFPANENPITVTDVFYSPSLKKLLVGSGSGLFILDSKFKEELHLPDIDGEVFKIAEGKTDKDNSPSIWVSTQLGNGITYVLDASGPVLRLNSFSADNGFPKDWIYPFSYNGKIFFGTNYGLFGLSGGSFDTVGISDYAELFNKKFDESFSNFESNHKGDYYYVSKNKVHQYKVKDNRDIEVPFIPIELGKINSLSVSGGELLISCEEGLVVYEERDLKNYDLNFPVILRKITTANDSVIYNGELTGKFTIPVNLAYSYNKLSLEFSSPFMFEEKSNLYCYKVEGMDTSFSNWQSENSINLSNLGEGSYKAIVKSKNIFGKESEPLVIEFVISPPWYRTALAYIAYGIVFVLVLVVTGKLASRRVKKQKEILEELVRQRTKEIEHKNVELEARNEQITHQKQEITDSINYAKRIQSAILTPVEEIRHTLKDMFILFMPKDIVSGDFYWYHQLNDEEFLIGCADCTGHGVPGGFMSMVCTDKLNEAIKQHTEPSEILKFVNKAIKKSLRQDGGEGTSKDGMEISILHVNVHTKHVTYAGANRFLWIIHHDKEELEDVKPTKAGIGGSTENSQEFESHNYHFRHGDQIYLSSDGYGDQFGGEKHKKLTTKRFKELLVRNRHLSIPEQHEQLRKHILEWRGDLEQVDDILVIGMKF